MAQVFFSGKCMQHFFPEKKIKNSSIFARTEHVPAAFLYLICAPVKACSNFSRVASFARGFYIWRCCCCCSSSSFWRLCYCWFSRLRFVLRLWRCTVPRRPKVIQNTNRKSYLPSQPQPSSACCAVALTMESAKNRVLGLLMSPPPHRGYWQHFAKNWNFIHFSCHTQTLFCWTTAPQWILKFLFLLKPL